MKLSGLARIDNIGPQHQVFYIALRQQYTLVAGQATGSAAADVKEAFDLFIGAANYLHFTILVNRAGY